LIIENNNELEYNNYSWFCPEDILTEGRVTLTCGRAGGLKFKFTRAGSGSGKELRRFFTDLKVPADARDSVIFVRQGDRVLWIPGAGHAEGFTGKQSKEKFEGSGRSAGRLLKITLERQVSQ
ncbi:MAG: tRNA lysidine(34) synthetase TilS, partial [Clostridiales bacterium]|nr:tRNA lysidine(34) synthetase TilS [Clostridiales bacterium]